MIIDCAECSRCYKPLPNYTFELKRYKPEIPRPICFACVQGIIEFGDLIEKITKDEDIEKPPR